MACLALDAKGELRVTRTCCYTSMLSSQSKEAESVLGTEGRAPRVSETIAFHIGAHLQKNATPSLNRDLKSEVTADFRVLA